MGLHPAWSTVIEFLLKLQYHDRELQKASFVAGKNFSTSRADATSVSSDNSGNLIRHVRRNILTDDSSDGTSHRHIPADYIFLPCSSSSALALLLLSAFSKLIPSSSSVSSSAP